MVFSVNKSIKALYLRFQLRSLTPFTLNVLKLAGGTAASQVISVMAVPLLARLYGPKSFGLLATFASILTLLNVVSSLRYELAIAVPEDDDDAVTLVWLCLVLVAITSCLTAFGVVLFGDHIVEWLNEPTLKKLLWLLPLGVLLAGFYKSMSYWAIRQKQFGLLAHTKFRQTLLGVFIKLTAASLGTIGLLIGQIVSQSAGFLEIFRLSKSKLLESSPFSISIVSKLAQYSHFGVFSSPAGFINILGSQVPIIIMASSFGSESVGMLALSLKLLIIPSGLISSSVSQVFLSRSSEYLRIGSLKSLVQKTSRKLFLYSVLFSILIVIFAPTLLPLVMGRQWAQSGIFALILIPMFIGQTTVSSVSTAFFAVQQNKTEFLAQGIQSLFRVVPMLTFVLFGFSFEYTVLAYSLGSLAGYLFYFTLLNNSLPLALD